MSPQQPLQLEGASLEDLLDQVRREHGPMAQIVKAEKDDVTETTQPATALQSGIQVALLDGTSATPAAWAGLLLDRMVAA